MLSFLFGMGLFGRILRQLCLLGLVRRLGRIALLRSLGGLGLFQNSPGGIAHQKSQLHDLYTLVQ